LIEIFKNLVLGQPPRYSANSFPLPPKGVGFTDPPIGDFKINTQIPKFIEKAIN